MHKDMFQTDDDGLYLYPSVANELALTPGEFNIPYGAYVDTPPAPSTGKWPRRVGDAWVMVADYRNTSLWVVETGELYTMGNEHDGVAGNVSYPGWGPLPAWLATEVPQAHLPPIQGGGVELAHQTTPAS